MNRRRNVMRSWQPARITVYGTIFFAAVLPLVLLFRRIVEFIFGDGP